MTLPPLPVTHVVVDGLWEDVHGPYSAEDMRAYAQAAALAERAACAALCDTRSADHMHDYKHGPVGLSGNKSSRYYLSDEADACAAAIRARGE